MLHNTDLGGEVGTKITDPGTEVFFRKQIIRKDKFKVLHSWAIVSVRIRALLFILEKTLKASVFYIILGLLILSKLLVIWGISQNIGTVLPHEREGVEFAGRGS